MRGYCHSEETFGTVDGPGIRYVLFLSGCRLGCAFCHNPDTWAAGAGRVVSVEEVVANVERCRAYYDRSGGGITVSGGEPLLQAGFVADLFAACRARDIHCVLDTAGYAPVDCLDRVLPETDAVLFSLKAMRADTHRRLTGADHDGIIANLFRAAAQKPLTVRYPLIPSVNDGGDELADLAALMRALPQKAVLELLPYHTMGRGKWTDLGLCYPLDGVPPAGQADMERAREIFARAGVPLF